MVGGRLEIFYVGAMLQLFASVDSKLLVSHAEEFCATTQAVQYLAQLLTDYPATLMVRTVLAVCFQYQIEMVFFKEFY